MTRKEGRQISLQKMEGECGPLVRTGGKRAAGRRRKEHSSLDLAARREEEKSMLQRDLSSSLLQNKKA